jgi:hypothetical protein
MSDNPTVRWQKSSYSDHAGGECVEVAVLSSAIGIRDSQNPDGPRLSVTPSAWQALSQRIKDGEHNLT